MTPADIDALYFDELRLEMRKYLRLAEKAERAYLARDAEIRHSYRNAEPFMMRRAQATDTELLGHATSVGFYRSMVGLCSDALQGEAAYARLTSSGPRPVVPAAPGARPGTGPASRRAGEGVSAVREGVWS